MFYPLMVKYGSSICEVRISLGPSRAGVEDACGERSSFPISGLKGVLIDSLNEAFAKGPTRGLILLLGKIFNVSATASPPSLKGAELIAVRLSNWPTDKLPN